MKSVATPPIATPKMPAEIVVAAIVLITISYRSFCLQEKKAHSENLIPITIQVNLVFLFWSALPASERCKDAKVDIEFLENEYSQSSNGTHHVQRIILGR